MFLFGKGVTDGVASELLGTISRILDESGKPLSARAIVKALEQSGELVPSGETPWKTVGARLSVDIRSNRESEFMRVGRGLYALTAWKDMASVDGPARRINPLDEDILVIERETLEPRKAGHKTDQPYAIQ